MTHPKFDEVARPCGYSVVLPSGELLRCDKAPRGVFSTVEDALAEMTKHAGAKVQTVFDLVMK